jgi:hypothetical protein
MGVAPGLWIKAEIVRGWSVEVCLLPEPANDHSGCQWFWVERDCGTKNMGLSCSYLESVHLREAYSPESAAGQVLSKELYGQVAERVVARTRTEDLRPRSGIAQDPIHGWPLATFGYVAQSRLPIREDADGIGRRRELDRRQARLRQCRAT